ncbi:hypothetical protein CORT_0B03540 [Candida orthopsilosis Co 90-125]|uniref:Lon protease homolog 2, peroxisomal n=1 Tax=Candida orthopsilosis (strain 90-125) TaxID=1136231 RepID=H8X123_CANO9|nr:hypothetical protein CORT_0B03540 [Candida orthopsilosis Co 90-125]CCG22063.1 hypothetical protein CORT_0B03540 [Candida orthopsilosis Co 90-125]
MARYSKSSKSKGLSQSVVLPTYQLDSNLVLLPGIIYNVTFSRFKAAALLYRFKNVVSRVSIINNLLAEYNFDVNSTNNTTSTAEGDSTNPSVISQDAVDGISQFYKLETVVNEDKEDETLSGPINDFDWLTFAISPNLDKILESRNKDATDFANVVTIVRVVGIVDDSTNIKLTFQALTRGVKVSDSRATPRPNEAKVVVDWNTEVPDIKNRFKILRSNYKKLFNSIEKFLIMYREALKNNAAMGSNNLSLTKDNLNDDKKQTDQDPVKQDLLTLNPLANALYMQLAGSKDFSKAFMSLQRLYSQIRTTSSSSEDAKVDAKTYLRLVDLTTAILPFPNYEKLRMLNKYKIDDRSDAINEMMLLLNDVFGALKQNNSFANNWFHNEASNVQRATVVSNQLKSIRVLLEGMSKRNRAAQKQPQSNQQAKPSNGANSKQSRANSPSEGSGEFEEGDDDEDELRVIADFIKNKLPTITSLSPDSKRLILKDFKRIKSAANSPGGGGNADFHVIRNYLEIVMDIPWDKYVSKFKTNREIDLKAARSQLDKDHYGLEHVKRRLIQYLVVLKLLGINAAKTIDEDKSKCPEKNANQKDATAGEQNGILIANGDETYRAKQRAQDQVDKSMEDSRFEEGALEAIRVTKSNKSPIIALAGPPGIGKTSIAKSIATSLGRNFQRLSLGGIKDESEIRGHRRTYVGAMPGLIIQALRKAGCMNPVILLDEIDKVVGGNSGATKYNGDPSAALLEVLDPEQNSTFIDHYLGFPVDLSQVIFICTANDPYNMTRPLLDRLELIEMGAYDYNEKLIIGQRYLLPRQVKRNGFPVSNEHKIEEFVNISKAALKKIIIDYTREAGVRNFERKLGTLCRFKAVEYCEQLNDSSKNYNPHIDENDLSIYLGVPFASGDFTANESTSIGNSRIGVVNGLSYNSEGSGSVLVFESIGFDRRTGNDNSSSGTGANLHMTGRLGEVLMESGKIGLTFIKSMIYKDLLKYEDEQGKQNTSALLNKFNNLDIHMHVPMGGIPKDGPSAGVTMALSFLSVLLDKPVPTDIAMTGEITLRGLVLPIGGVKEKLLGAHLSHGIKRMIVPRENRKDLIEEYSKSIMEEKHEGKNNVKQEGSHDDLNFLNQLLKDNEEVEFKMDNVEQFYLKKYGIQLNYAREFYDVIKIVWNEEEVLLKEESNQKRLLEYRI